jgi:hypothetical protein
MRSQCVNIHDNNSLVHKLTDEYDIRKVLMRRGINQRTLEKICKRKPVRTAKLAQCLKALEDYERENSISDKESSRCLTKI